MKKDGKFLLFLKEPPAWFLILWYFFTLCLIAASVAVLILCEDAAWAVVIYALAAVALAYTVYSLIYAIPKIKRELIARLRKNKYADSFISDYGIRTLIFAVISVVINVANIVINGVTAISDFSIWYACMTAYYLVLGLLRGGILFFGRKIAIRNKENKLSADIAKNKMYLGCGIYLLVSEIVLVFAVTQIIQDDSHIQTNMILAIAVAAYTFYKFTLAIINIVRAKRFRDPAVQCLRNINLVDALVSMLSLEITLIAATGSGENMTVMNAVTGGAVCAFNVVLGVIMIIQAAKKLKEQNNGTEKSI